MMRGDVLHGDAMHADAMRADAMRGDVMRSDDVAAHRAFTLRAIALTLSFALLAWMPVSASAQSPVNASAAVQRGAVIHLRLQSGSVKLSGWQHDSVHVSGLLAPGESWSMRADGDTMRLRADGLPRGLAAPSELEIFVPMHAPLVVRAAAASLVVRDFDMSVDVATAAGNLLVEEVRGPVRASTMQGTLTVLGPAPSVEASTASGALLVSMPYDTINEVVYERRRDGATSGSPSFGNVVVRSVSGLITFVAPTVRSAEIHNVRGDIRLVTSPLDSGQVVVTNHAGRVTLGWTANMSAVLDALTYRGGVRGRVPVQNASAGDVDVSTRMTRESYGVRVSHLFGGASTARAPGAVRVRSVRGDVIFEKADIRPARE